MDLGKDLVAASATPLVLAILAEGDSYGYAIIKRVNELSGGHCAGPTACSIRCCTGSSGRGSWRRSGARPRAAAGASTTASPRKGERSSRPSSEQWQVVDDTLRGIWMKAQHGMTAFADRPPLEEQIAQWRGYLRRRRAIDRPDVEELEGHLRDQVAALTEAGLAGDEAFLVAVKRMGSLDALSREFAREHSERLWKQLVIAPDDAGTEATQTSRTEALVVLGLAVAAALAIKIPVLFGVAARRRRRTVLRSQRQPVRPAAAHRLLRLEAGTRPDDAVSCWRCRSRRRPCSPTSFHSRPAADTEVLTALHLPIALWLAVGRRLRRRAAGSPAARRMDFVRFSGELFIYYVLIALGGGVLTGFTVMMFSAIGMNADGWSGSGCCRAARWAPSSSDPGWWRPSRASSRTWRRC